MLKITTSTSASVVTLKDMDKTDQYLTAAKHK